MLNDKLYAQYYPIRTEEEKNAFLSENSSELRKIIKYIGDIARNEIYAIKHEYVKKMKPTESFLGTPKYQNILHNERLAHEMQTDQRVRNITEKLPDLEDLEYKVAYHEYENITVDELNYVLEFVNHRKHKLFATSVLLLVALAELVYVFTI